MKNKHSGGRNKKPASKKYKVITISMPPEIHKALKRTAKQNGETISGTIYKMLEAKL